jgi:hypothetical protein
MKTKHNHPQVIIKINLNKTNREIISDYSYSIRLKDCYIKNYMTSSVDAFNYGSNGGSSGIPRELSKDESVLLDAVIDSINKIEKEMKKLVPKLKRPEIIGYGNTGCQG